MIKVNNMDDAWNLASRLFPTDYEKDEERSANAGYGIYYSTALGVDAWISDLGNRLELNYPNGLSENIWIEEKPDVLAIVGVYHEDKIFGDVSVKKVKEITYRGIQGLVNKVLDDGRMGIEITLADDGIASFGCENVAYVRFK